MQTSSQEISEVKKVRRPRIVPRIQEEENEIDPDILKELFDIIENGDEKMELHFKKMAEKFARA